MSNNHFSSQKIASRSPSFLPSEELKWNRENDEMFISNKNNQDISQSQQPEPQPNVSFLILSTIFLIFVTATWAKASPTYRELQPQGINSTTELIELITDFE